MPDRQTLISSLRAAMLPALCIAAIAYFAFFAVSGGTGLLAWQDYRAQRLAVEAEGGRVAAHEAALRRQVALLDPNGVDRDLADELVRRNLNVVGPDEVIIPLPEAR